EQLQRKKIITKYLMIFLFIIILFLISIVLKTIIYPYLKKEKNRKSVASYLRNNNYTLNYQPIVDPKTNKIIAFESLIRLRIDEKIIYPNILISQVEHCDMMSELSIWILEKITKDYSIVNKSKNLNNDFYLSMNISLKEIEDEKVCNRFIEILKNSDLNDKSICLEITENVSGKDYIQIRKNVKMLMDSGFLIAIDDFGVDYSNLSFLEELDFNIIKLDKYFIDHFYNSIVVQSLIDAIHYISLKKDVSIVIEGVEEKDQVESIKNFKSDKFYIQGYYYSKPVEIDALNKIKIDD
ncbi:MAG: EAL domain-containing protein, partial [Peptostreptococcaceae bacterium]